MLGIVGYYLLIGIVVVWILNIGYALGAKQYTSNDIFNYVESRFSTKKETIECTLFGVFLWPWIIFLFTYDFIYNKDGSLTLEDKEKIEKLIEEARKD